MIEGAFHHESSDRMPSAPGLSLACEERVVIAGDWHGNSAWLGICLPAIARFDRSKPPIRTILHAGDFGLGPDRRSQKFLASVDWWAARAGITRILVTPGNHENWAYLDTLFGEAGPGRMVHLSETVWVMPRGFRFLLMGKHFLSFGGAASIDYSHRKMGESWWSTEMPTEEDVARAIEGGLVDVLLTHEAPNASNGTTEVAEILNHNPQSWPPEALEYSALSRRRINKVFDGVSALNLFHGHMHVSGVTELSPDRYGRMRNVISLGMDFDVRNLGVLRLTTLDFEWMTSDANRRPKHTRNVDPT